VNSSKEGGDQMPELKATYEKDSKRYHLFTIQENEYGIVGSIYVPKNSSSNIPNEFTVKLEVPAETKG